jgi:LCP family protein required for cell wall assembly
MGLAVPPRRARSGLVAAILSFLVPGLGQLWAGARRRAGLFLLPVVVLAVGAVTLLARGQGYLVGVVLQPQVLLGLVILNVALIAFRALAIVDAYRLPDRTGTAHRTGRLLANGVVAALVAVVVLTHGALAYVGYQAYDLVTGVFQEPATGQVGGSDEEPALDPRRDVEEDSTPSPAPSGKTAGAVPRKPAPVNRAGWSDDGFLNVLLIGADAGPGRWGLRTDTMIVGSVHIATGRAALFGVPRSLVNVPLPAETAAAFPCRCYPRQLNSLYSYAGLHRNLFPGGANRGFRAIAGAIEELLRLKLDGMLVADLNGFVKLVDALGGVQINVPKAVRDEAYPTEDGKHHIRIYIPAGPQRMDGTRALQYVRSRNQDTDYHRMRRQQLLLVALRRQVNVCSLLPRLPELVAIGRRTLKTDLPISELPRLLEVLQRVDANRVHRVVFTPPSYREHLTAREVGRIRQAVRTIFAKPPAPEERVDPGAGSAC